MKNGTKKNFSKQEVKHSYLTLKSAKWHFPKNWLVQTVQHAQTFALGPFFLVYCESEIKKVTLHNIKENLLFNHKCPDGLGLGSWLSDPTFNMTFTAPWAVCSESIFMLHVVVQSLQCSHSFKPPRRWWGLVNESVLAPSWDPMSLQTLDSDDD